MASYQTTIDDLPNEVLTLIFRRINFHGRLRLGCVCKRWLEVTENDIVFMRSVNFRVFKGEANKMTKKNITNLMRNYQLISFSEYSKFEHLHALEVSMLETVESLVFSSSFIRDTSELLCILQHCKRLKKINLYSRRMVDSMTLTSEKYQKPVELTIDSPGCKSLACFAAVSHINVRNWDCYSRDMKCMVEFIKNHSAQITAMEIYEQDNDDLLQLLSKTKDLRLKSMKMYFYEPKFVTAKEQLFIQQQLFTTKFSAHGYINRELFDVMRLRLTNLEAVRFEIAPGRNIRLNDLKLLTKLRSLTVHIREFEEPYELDVGELSLTELIIEGSAVCELVIKQQQRPMYTLKKLSIAGFGADKEMIGHCADCMPNLKELKLSNYYYNKASAIEINKPNNLVSLEINSLLDDQFFSTLQLPKLEQLKVQAKISRPELDLLANNCPKLLRILQTIETRRYSYDPYKFRICVRRMNGFEKFRRVKPIKKEHFQKFDYDSVESCSDADDDDEIVNSVNLLF